MSKMDVESGTNPPVAVVIGAGFGGLSVAARLQSAGYQVTVVERNQVPGGRCAEILKDGHRFDVGPSILLVPDAFREAFAAVGDDLDQKVDFLRVDPTYTIHFHDGSNIELTADLQRMSDQLERMEQGSFKSFLRLINKGHENLHQTLDKIAHRNFYSVFEFFSPYNAWLLYKLNVLFPHFRYVSGLFTDPRLRAAFSFQDMYIGVSPYDAPATFSLLQYTEFCQGVWYCKGGLNRIADALADSATRCGVKFMYNAPVQRIEVQGDKATGVVLEGGQTLHADVVVANADLPYVYRNLLPDVEVGKGMDKLYYTSSAIMFYWGVAKKFDQLGTHNMFLARDFKGSFEDIFTRHTLPAEPSFYINVPSRVDPTAAPSNEDTLMVLVPCGHLETTVDQQWPETVARARQAVLDKIRTDVGIEDFEKHIKFEITYTPKDWEQMFNLHKGSCFGLSHTFFQLGFMRPHNQHQKYRNLFFTGCSTHPGSGLPNVLVSARLCAQRVLLHEAGFSTGPPLGLRGFLIVKLWFGFVLWLCRSGYPLTYLGFHLLFTLPPTLWLLFRVYARSQIQQTVKPHVAHLVAKLHAIRIRGFLSIGVLCCLSLTYTTPWDNYLVYKQIWSYPPDRVLLVLGWVPLEEYSFFVIQTVMTSLFLLAALEREQLSGAAMQIVGAMGKGENTVRSRSNEDFIIRMAGTMALLLLSAYGWYYVFFADDSKLYLGLILGWALPVLALQWFFGGHVVWKERAIVLYAAGIPTLFLWFGDGLAIAMNIWNINPRYLIGLYCGSLPFEEALFFVCTNMMVVQGVLLFIRAAERMESDRNDGKQESFLRRVFNAAWRL